MILSAPAKINLSLEVLGRRADGFHDIRTLMVPLSLADAIEIEQTSNPGVTFTCSDPSLPVNEENLCVRAANRFFARWPQMEGVQIRLEKKVPHGAGLGGGSSDAAAVLRGMRDLFSPSIADEELRTVAAELGSDIPFFVSGQPAICEGRGERINPVEFRERLPLLLMKPPFPVPTPWAYKQWKDSIEIPGVPYGPQIFPWGALVNHLERPVFEKHIFLARLKRWLLEQAEVTGALLSGSGSTMFAVLRDKPAGEQLRSRLGAEFGASLWIHPCSVAINTKKNGCQDPSGGPTQSK